MEKIVYVCWFTDSWNGDWIDLETLGSFFFRWDISNIWTGGVLYGIGEVTRDQYSWGQSACNWPCPWPDQYVGDWDAFDGESV